MEYAILQHVADEEHGAMELEGLYGSVDELMVRLRKLLNAGKTALVYELCDPDDLEGVEEDE